MNFKTLCTKTGVNLNEGDGPVDPEILIEEIMFYLFSESPNYEQFFIWTDAKGLNRNDVLNALILISSKFSRFWFGGISGKRKTGSNDVNEEQLKMGIEVEFEHTPDTDVALKIALDHLSEAQDPEKSEYYTLLKRHVDSH